MDYSYYGGFEKKCRQSVLGDIEVEFSNNVTIKALVPLDKKEEVQRTMNDISDRKVKTTEIETRYAAACF